MLLRNFFMRSGGRACSVVLWITRGGRGGLKNPDVRGAPLRFRKMAFI